MRRLHENRVIQLVKVVLVPKQRVERGKLPADFFRAEVAPPEERRGDQDAADPGAGGQERDRNLDRVGMAVVLVGPGPRDPFASHWLERAGGAGVLQQVDERERANRPLGENLVLDRLLHDKAAKHRHEKHRRRPAPGERRSGWLGVMFIVAVGRMAMAVRIMSMSVMAVAMIVVTVSIMSVVVVAVTVWTIA